MYMGLGLISQAGIFMRYCNVYFQFIWMAWYNPEYMRPHLRECLCKCQIKDQFAATVDFMETPSQQIPLASFVRLICLQMSQWYDSWLQFALAKQFAVLTKSTRTPAIRDVGLTYLWGNVISKYNVKIERRRTMHQYELCAHIRLLSLYIIRSKWFITQHIPE